MTEYTKINSMTWDVWAKNNCEWSMPITHEEYIKYLTPCVAVPQYMTTLAVKPQ